MKNVLTRQAYMQGDIDVTIQVCYSVYYYYPKNGIVMKTQLGTAVRKPDILNTVRDR